MTSTREVLVSTLKSTFVFKSSRVQVQIEVFLKSTSTEYRRVPQNRYSSTEVPKYRVLWPQAWYMNI